MTNPRTKFALALAVLCLSLCLTLCASADNPPLTPTDEWTPPDLSGLTAESDPGLLVLAVAQGELGYVEGPNNESKYGTWFCGRNVQWCAEFLTWCVNEAELRYGVSLMHDVYPWYGRPEDGAPFFMEKARFVSDTGIIPVTNQTQWWIETGKTIETNEYIPSAGDYMWFYLYTRKEGTTHVAICEGVSVDPDGSIRVHVIEGNMPDRVQRATYSLDEQGIYGFGTSKRIVMCSLRLYHQSEDVVWLKDTLATLGFYDPPANDDDVFDADLQDALRAFQRSVSIRADAVMKQDTWFALVQALEHLSGTNDP